MEISGVSATLQSSLGVNIIKNIDVINMDTRIEGTTRAEDAQGTPTPSRISPSLLAYEDNRKTTL